MLAGSPDAGPVPRLHTLSDIGRTASRRSRLIAAVVDSAVAVAVTVPAGVLGLLLATRFPGQGWLVVVLPGSVLLGYFLLQAVGLALRGQTIAKALDGTKVVRADGAPAGFLRAVFLRSIAMPLAAFVAGPRRADCRGGAGALGVSDLAARKPCHGRRRVADPDAAAAGTSRLPCRNNRRRGVRSSDA